MLPQAFCANLARCNAILPPIPAVTLLPVGFANANLKEFLGSAGIFSLAKKGAKYEVDPTGRHRFKVEIEDIPAGIYSLYVGTIRRASIRAALITPEGATLFTHLFGSGSAISGSGGNTGGNTQLPASISQAPFAHPGALGSILTTYEVQDDGDIKLKRYPPHFGTHFSITKLAAPSAPAASSSREPFSSGIEALSSGKRSPISCSTDAQKRSPRAFKGPCRKNARVSSSICRHPMKWAKSVTTACHA